MAVYTDTVLMGMEELNLQPGDTAKHTIPSPWTGDHHPDRRHPERGSRSRRRRYAYHP